MQKLRAEALNALDSQLAVLNYYKSEEGRMSVVYFIMSMVRKGDIPRPPDEDDIDEYVAKTGMRVGQELTGALGQATTFYMTEEMMALTLHAGEQVPPTPFVQDDLPTPSGFLALPQPLIIRDVHGLRLSTRAIAWWSTEVQMRNREEAAHGLMVPSIMFAFLSHKHDVEDDDYLIDLRANDPKKWLQWPLWSLAHWQWINFHDAIGRLGDKDIQVRTTEWEDAAAAIHSIAFLKTFFLLVKQEIGVQLPQSIDRAMYRRMKGSIMPDYGDLRIITLRRVRPRNGEEGTGTEVEWSHRWVVSGHWSNQYHPSCAKCQTLGHACKEHEPTWIEAYEKGPENKPLIIKDKVFVWKR